jgi:hypothetical protein
LKPRRASSPPPSVDPKLLPFVDALADLLVADELRRAEARRGLREATRVLRRGKGTKR